MPVRLSPIWNKGNYELRWTRERGAWQGRVIRGWWGGVTLDALSKRRLPPEPVVPVPETFISVGLPADFNVNDFRERGYAFVIKKADETEVSRTVSLKRVENPEDPSQFVDIERIDELEFKRNGRKDNQIYKFKNPE